MYIKAGDSMIYLFKIQIIKWHGGNNVTDLDSCVSEN